MVDKRDRSSTHTNGDRSSSKRRKTLDVVEAEITVRSVDPEVALDVDIMILDYQAYRACHGMLEDTNHDSTQHAASIQHVVMFQSFLDYFRQQYPEYNVDKQLSLRLALLEFVALYHKRMVPGPFIPSIDDLRQMREHDLDRSDAWKAAWSQYEDDTQITAQQHDCIRQLQSHIADRRKFHRRRILTTFEEVDYALEDRSPFYGSSQSVSLLDLLPKFMRLCASAFALHNRSLNHDGLLLCKAFICQALLEHFLVFSPLDSRIIEHALAWGCYPVEPGPGTERDLHIMFCDEDGSESIEWRRMKSDLIEELSMFNQGEPGPARLELLWRKYPMDKFDATIREFLNDISSFVDEPILRQVENGKIDALSPEDSARLLQECGLDGTGIS